MISSEIKDQIVYMEKVKKLNNKTLFYNIITMGCKLNENDSEKICGMLENMGYIKTDNFENCNLFVINTCCVRENAEEKLFGKLGQLKKYKEKNNALIAVGGCMMQEEHIQSKIKSSYPFVDVVFGTHTFQNLPEDIYKTLIENKKIRDILNVEGKIFEGLPTSRIDKKQASVTIMYGCNNFCAYCIVPYVRGRERSRKPNDILDEVRELANQGYKEVMLLGQNVNSYIGDTQEYGFANLLRDVCKISGIEIVKFMSPHPKDFSDDVIDAIAENSKVSRILHVPLQSGSSEILKKMNRKYTKEQYLELINKIKVKIPNAAISTDIIVGFPGETEEDFLDSLDVVEKVKFEQVYMFIYSRRVGTVADKMENQIPEEIKHERFNRLKILADNLVEENSKKYIGTIQNILVEGFSKTNHDMLVGRTDSNKIVVFRAKEELIGTVVKVKIISEHRWFLKGIVV